MAIVKASYRKGGSSGAIKYALHREQENEEAHTQRQGFTADRDGLNTRQSVEELKQHEQGKGYTYHVILNPGDGQNTPADLQQWTRDTMRSLEQKHGRDIPYVAVVHQDHSGHAHVHVIAHTEKTLRKEELNHTRSEATRLYERQRELYRDHHQDQRIPETQQQMGRDQHRAESQHRGGEQVRSDQQRNQQAEEGRRNPEAERGSGQAQEQRRERQQEQSQERNPTGPRRGFERYTGMQWENTTRQQDADEQWLNRRPSMVTDGATTRAFIERYQARQKWLAEKKAEQEQQRKAAQEKWREKAQAWRQEKQETRDSARKGQKILRDLGYGR